MRPLYVDNHVLALDKPCGLLTQPSGQTADSLERQGKELLRQMFAKPGNVFLEAVHRLDRPACGVVLFARTSKALSRLNAAMRGHGCVKRYRAILAATPRDHDGELTDWLVHDDFRARAASPTGCCGRCQAAAPSWTSAWRRDATTRYAPSSRCAAAPCSATRATAAPPPARPEPSPSSTTRSRRPIPRGPSR